MHRFAFFLLAAILAGPFAVQADTIPLEALCRNHTGNPTGSQIFEESGPGEVMDTFLKQRVLCPNACYDVTLTISVNGDNKLTISVSAVNRCKGKQDASKLTSVYSKLTAPDEGRNCSAGKGLPSVTATTRPLSTAQVTLGKFFGYSIPEVLAASRTVGPKSRCDQSADSVIAAFTQNEKRGLDVGFDRLAALPPASPAPIAQSNPVPDASQSPIQPVAAEPDKPTQEPAAPQNPQVPPQNNPTTGGTENIQAGLQQKLSLSDDDIRKLAQDPDAAADLSRRLQAGDVAGAQKVAKGLGLNEDVMSKIASIDPAGSPNTNPAAAQTQNDPTPGNNSTFAANPRTETDTKPQPPPGGRWGETMKSAEDKYTNVAETTPGVLSKFAKIESNGNPTICSPTNACGLYQYIPSTWVTWCGRYAASENASVDCGVQSRLDPDLSSRVTAYYLSQNLQKYGGLIQSSGMDPNAALYAIHNIGDGGGPRFIAAYMQNPNQQVGQILGYDSAAVRYNPGLYGDGTITLAQAQANMLAKMGGSTNFVGGPTYTTGSPFNVGTSFNTGGTNSPYYSPPMPTGYSNSPFGYSNPFYSYGASTPAPQPQSPPQSSVPGGANAPVSPMQSVLNYFTTPQQPTVQKPAALTPPKAVGTIIAQPARVGKGQSITVSWSSVATAPGTCKTVLEDAGGSYVLAQSTEGSKSITASSTGVLRFVFICTSSASPVLTQEASVVVQ